MTMIHVSTKVKSKPTKKRTVKCFTCLVCHSTFDTILKMKKHTLKEHEVEEEPKSPVRKVAKTLDIEKKTKSEDQQDDKFNVPDKKHKEMTETLIAAMQTIENLEEQNSELHIKIDHLGQVALLAEDLKTENSSLKTCDHCNFEFITQQNLKEHMCKKKTHTSNEDNVKNIIDSQKRQILLMEQENIKLFNKKLFSKMTQKMRLSVQQI